MIKMRDVYHADISHDLKWEYIQPNPLKTLSWDSVTLFIWVKDEKKYYVNSKYEIDYAINVFVRIIKKLNLSNEDEIIRDYIRMCFLDCLTGNKDRVGGFIKK